MNDSGNKETFAKNLAYYMELHQKSRGDLCRALDLKYTTLTGWLNAEKYPRIDKIELLARYFNIEKSDLIEARNPSGKQKKITLLARKVEAMPSEDREFLEELIESTIDTYLKNRKKK